MLRKGVALWVCLLLITAGLVFKTYSCLSKSTDHDADENMLPPLIMIDETVYKLDTSVRALQLVDKDGTIKDVVNNVIPSMNEQSNFGYLGMEYWRLDDGIIIKMHDNFLKFKKMQIE